MKMKQLLIGSSSICMLAAAALMFQSVVTNQASASPRLSEDQSKLLDRVRALEIQQLNDNREFLLVDATLMDMKTQFDGNLSNVRLQLNKLGIPVKPLIGDEIGLPLMATPSGYRNNKLPGNGGVNPAGKRK